MSLDVRNVFVTNVCPPYFVMSCIQMYSTYREGKSIADGSTFLLMLLLLQNHLLYYFKAFPLMGTLEGLL